MLELARINQEVFDVSGYATIENDRRNVKVHGITPVIHEITGKKYNFSVGYQPVVTGTLGMTYMKREKIRFNKINGTFKLPHTYFSIYGSNIDFKFIRTSLPITDSEMYVLVTPSEAYTPYEKLFLPFDRETWILLLITFFVTFFVILVINRMFKSAQQIVYGHKVKNPFMNVVSIFFGISQTQLPVESFPRFILVLFIFFCLIFRTCYQNKLFQFMTHSPRKTPPKTIEDIIDRNYTVNKMLIKDISNSIYDENGRKLNTSFIKIRKAVDMYKTQSQNTTAKLALCVDDVFINDFEHKTKTRVHWNRSNKPLYTIHELFAFFHFSFYFRMYKKVIDKLIDTGVMSFLFDNHYSKKQKFAKIYSEPVVLKIEDLNFGFNIWLGFCSFSIVAIFFECLFKPKKSKLPQKVKFMKIYPTNEAIEDFKDKMKPETLKKFRVKKMELKMEKGEIQNISESKKSTVQLTFAEKLKKHVDSSIEEETESIKSIKSLLSLEID